MGYGIGVEVHGAETVSGAGVSYGHRFGRAVLAVLLLSTAVACKDENKYVAPPTPKVGVAQPASRPVTRYLELTGNTVSLDKVDLVARVEGFLQQINYKDSSMVKKGDSLFTIEPAPYQAKVALAEAAVTVARSAVKQAEPEFQRQLTLVERQVAPQTKLDAARKDRDQAMADLQKAQAALELAQIELGYTNVTAPFDGIVTTHLAAVGALVGGSSPTKLATILRLDPIYVTANFSEQDVLRIIADPSGISTADLGRIPIEIGLMTETGYPRKGVIDYIAPQVDASTGTLRLRGVFANPDYSLLPGLFARVRLAPSQNPEQALLLPETALGSDQAGRYVLVVDRDNVVHKRTVAVGPVIDGMRVIENGLSPEDRVIVSGAMRAIPGQKVSPEKEELAAVANRADAAR